MDPAVSGLIVYIDDYEDLQGMISNWLKNKKILIIPVNDNED